MHQTLSHRQVAFGSPRKITLIFVESDICDYVSAFESAARELDLDYELVRIPHFKIQQLTLDRLKEIRSLIVEKAHDRFVIFCPSISELYLDEPNVTLAFSAYRNWLDPDRIRVIPHPWSLIDPPKNLDKLKWIEKPPLRISFMGSSYATAKGVRLANKLPSPLKRWLLSGRYLKSPRNIALLNKTGRSHIYINAFPRFETINFVRSQRGNFSDVDLEIVGKDGFAGTSGEKTDYFSHLLRSTYILCPRGCENFSFRVYEALKFGRVPVIIDTDMVLPPQFDWERLAIIVPYDSLEQVVDVIRQDYRSKSAKDFLERQEAGLATMHNLNTGVWIKDLLTNILSQPIS